MRKLLSQYGMVLVLMGLCLVFSVLTFKRQIPSGQAAVTEVSAEIVRACSTNDLVLAVGASNRESARFAEAVSATLQANGFTQVQINVPPEKAAACTLFVVTCGYVPDVKRSYGWQPPPEVLKQLETTADAECP